MTSQGKCLHGYRRLIYILCMKWIKYGPRLVQLAANAKYLAVAETICVLAHCFRGAAQQAKASSFDFRMLAHSEMRSQSISIWNTKCLIMIRILNQMHESITDIRQLELLIQQKYEPSFGCSVTDMPHWPLKFNSPRKRQLPDRELFDNSVTSFTIQVYGHPWKSQVKILVFYPAPMHN